MRFDFHSRTEGSHRQNRKLCHRTPPKIALCLDGKHKKPLAALDPVDRGNPLLHHLPNPETQALRGSFVTRAEHVWGVLVARSKLLLLAVTITAYAYSPPPQHFLANTQQGSTMRAQHSKWRSQPNAF